MRIMPYIQGTDSLSKRNNSVTLSRLSMLVRVNVVLNRTVVDSNCCFVNLSPVVRTLKMTTDYRTSCRNVSYCQQQSNSGLLSPGRSRSTYLWNKCWAQTFHNTSTFRCAIEFLFFCTLIFPAFLSSTQNRAKKTRIYSCLQDIFAKNNRIINICYNLSNKKDHWAFITNKFSSFSVYLSFIQS